MITEDPMKAVRKEERLAATRTVSCFELCSIGPLL
jgi:hypothetical protein